MNRHALQLVAMWERKDVLVSEMCVDFEWLLWSKMWRHVHTVVALPQSNALRLWWVCHR